jgi:hypothetical protein
MILLLTATGRTIPIGSEAFSREQVQLQGHVYDSMIWLQNNSSPDAVVASVNLFKLYRYLPIVTARQYAGDFPLASNDLLKLEPTLHFNYVAVSANLGSVRTFYQSDKVRMVYENSDVVVFLVLGS